MPTRRSTLHALVWTVFVPVPAFAAATPIDLAPGSGQFVFEDAQGDPTKRMTVCTYRPKDVDVTAARIVFVMHGHSKDADGYRDTWIPFADRDGFIVIAPLFDPGQWSGGAYSYASVEDRNGTVRDPSLWSFSVIEHLFDAVRQATGNRTSRYFLYGHSEGAQFVHRLVLLMPDARFETAVAANAGWYMMPLAGIRFPFGLEGAPIDETSLRKSLARRLVVLLGERDTDPNHRQLNRSPPAMAEGKNRFERGNRFFEAARLASDRLGVPFGWRLETVPGAAHENSKMSKAGAETLMR